MTEQVDYILGTVVGKGIEDITITNNTMTISYSDGETQTFTLSGGGNDVSVDTAMDSSSNNPVANRIIKAYVDDHTHFITPTDDKLYYLQGQGQYISLYTKIQSLENNIPSGSSFAPVYHASTATTYGVGSASQYGHVRVDENINSSSTNPVQNKAIKSYVDNAVDTILDDYVGVTTQITPNGSEASMPVTSKAIYEALAAKADSSHSHGWDSVNLSANGKVWYNNDIRLAEVFYSGSLAHTSGWVNTGVTVPSPYRPVDMIYCNCSNLNTIAYINTSGQIFGIHTDSNQTGLTFHAMYHY